MSLGQSNGIPSYINQVIPNKPKSYGFLTSATSGGVVMPKNVNYYSRCDNECTIDNNNGCDIKSGQRCQYLIANGYACTSCVCSDQCQTNSDCKDPNQVCAQWGCYGCNKCVSRDAETSCMSASGFVDDDTWLPYCVKYTQECIISDNCAKTNDPLQCAANCAEGYSYDKYTQACIQSIKNPKNFGIFDINMIPDCVKKTKYCCQQKGTCNNDATIQECAAEYNIECGPKYIGPNCETIFSEANDYTCDCTFDQQLQNNC